MTVGNSELRVATIKAGTLVGEMGFFNKFPRTAMVLAEERSVVFRLEEREWRRLKQEHPEIAMKFYDFTINLLSKRIISKNKELQALLS